MLDKHAEANVGVNYPGLSQNPPGVTTVLTIGDTAYISSAMVGGAYLYDWNGEDTGSRYTKLRTGRLRNSKSPRSL